MNWTIYAMEMKRHFKSFAIWSASICGIIFFGILFYPAISADGLLTQMETLFENPMMKGMLAAFGTDVYSMSTLTGFYVTYNSIYNVLLACIFASVLAGNLLAREESEKTAEFLFTRPVERKGIFISKAAVLFSYITLLCLLYFLTSLLSMEAVKGESGRVLTLSEKDKKLIMKQIESHPGDIYEAFSLTDESFARYSLSYASGMLSAGRSEAEAMDLAPDALSGLISEAAESPEAFFERILAHPEEYMALLSIPPGGREEFLENVREEREQYASMKEDFYRSPELFLMFFEADPSLPLDQFVLEPGSMDKAVALLGLPSDTEERIFGKYSVGVLAVLCFYIFLLVCSLGSLVLLISLLVKRGRSVLGAALGIIFFFYFTNSLSAMAGPLSPLAAGIGYISPFTWMDTDFDARDFGLCWWRILLFAALSSASLLGALKVFSRKDVLV